MRVENNTLAIFCHITKYCHGVCKNMHMHHVTPVMFNESNVSVFYNINSISFYFSGMTAISTYFLTKELWNSRAGLFAACFIAIGTVLLVFFILIVYCSCMSF